MADAVDWVIVVVDSNPEPWPEPESLRQQGASDRVVREYILLHNYFRHVVPWAASEFRN